MGLVVFILFMLIIPMSMATSIRRFVKFENIGMCYIMAILFMWSLWHLLCIPFWIYQWSFTVLCQIYSCLIVAIAILSIIGGYKLVLTDIDVFKREFRKSMISKYAVIYVIMAIGLVFYQVYKTVVSDMTYNAADDYIYISFSNAAVYNDKIGMTNALGNYAIQNGPKYMLQTNIWFIAYLAKICGLPVTLIAHTVYPVFLLLLSYLAVYMLSTKIFSNIENRMIFMILVSILYIYGFYSMYSVTFRLLGPIWQGKAILATFFLPLLLYMCIEALQQNYHYTYGISFLICSVASVSMSLGGIITMMAVMGIIIFLTLLSKERCWKHILYMLWGWSYPFGIGVVYLIMR